MFALPTRARLRAIPLVVALVAMSPALVAVPADAALLTVTNVTPPSYTFNKGAPEVGATALATPGTWNPSSSINYAYQWLADGTNIAGATSHNLAITSAHLGKKLSVRVTASRFLYTSGTATSAESAPVQNPTVRNLSLPTVTGTPKIDNSLGAGTGSWSPAGTYAYQWLADGTAIEGATAVRYTLTAAEVGKKMAVRITASKDGYNTGVATSALTSTVLPGVAANTSPPSLFGTFKVGKTVGVNTGQWSPSSVEWTYRWFANGVLIPGVTTKTFVLDASLRGKTLRAEVTGAKAGYTSAVATSPSSTAVTCSAIAPATLTKAGVTTSRIRVNWTKAFCATKYVVSYRLANATVKKNITVGDVSTHALTGLLKGRSYRIWVSSIGADGVQSASTPSILVKTAS